MIFLFVKLIDALLKIFLFQRSGEEWSWKFNVK